MRLIRKDDKMILSGYSVLYVGLFFGIAIMLLALINFNWLTIITGLLMIIIISLVPLKKIILDYKKKELSFIKESFIPVFKTVEIYPVENIEGIYAEPNLKNTSFFMNYSNVILVEKNGAITTLFQTIPNDQSVFIEYSRYRYIAEAMDKKIKELQGKKKR